MIYGGHFDPDKKHVRIKELESLINQVDFWNNKKDSEKVISELNDLKRNLDSLTNLKNKIESNYELLEVIKKDFDQEIKDLLETDLNEIETNLVNLEVIILLSDEYDHFNAIMEIHSGAGGTEACDWASMLMRMYLRYFDKKDYKYELIEEQAGDEVGIKSATIIVKGNYAYGYLKNEKGVHRLVRLSPFDTNNKRHTSFASIDITPLFENNDIDIEIKEEDLKVDVYRSSGAGGQHVNTTDSAVRITHLPSKTVVTCQVERSQIKNRERALEILKNKLYQQELSRRDNELSSIKGNNMAINFGSQIRSYVMHPYSLVKDHRTNFENTNVNKVLDGDLDSFINANLKRGN
jgi:peptide chain release factor 2